MSQSELKVAGETAAPEAQARGFEGLTCLKCGEENYVQLDLQDVDRVYCTSCESEYSLREDVAPAVAAWRRVLDWASLAPAAE
jgi:transcription elongation factor Elf1